MEKQVWEAELNSPYNICRSPMIVRGPKAIFGVNRALGSIQCFFVDSIAPEPPNLVSAGCQTVTIGEIELFTF